MSKEAKETKAKKPVDQMKIARIIANEMPNLTLSEIQAVIQREQELTIMAVAEGRKVVKKNYLTIYPSSVKAKTWVSPLNGQSYQIPKHNTVCVRVGEGFKSRVAERKMPRKLCRTAVEKQNAEA